jgi:PhnB protein
MAVTGKRTGQQPVSLLPQLSVRGGLAALDFYRAAFGAEVVYQVGGTADNQSVVAQLSIEGASFWVADESPAHGNFSPESVGGSTTRMLLIVDDPHAAIDRAVAAGATLVYPAAKEHGWLLGRIHDPFGHHWEIGKPLGAWPPDHAAHGSDVRVRASTPRAS